LLDGASQSPQFRRLVLRKPRRVPFRLGPWPGADAPLYMVADLMKQHVVQIERPKAARVEAKDPSARSTFEPGLECLVRQLLLHFAPELLRDVADASVINGQDPVILGI
jgi:hypothetical protein